MNANNGGFANNNSSTDSEESQKISHRLRICMYLLLSVAFLRILSSQFYALINDLSVALIVYFTYKCKGKIIAIFTLISALLAVLTSISIGINEISRLNGANIPPVTNKANNNLYNLNNNPVNNFSLPNNSNKDLNANTDKNAYNKYNSNKGNLKDSDFNNSNENNAYLDNGLNNPNQATSSSGFKYTLVIITTVYAVLVYCALSFLSYKAFVHYNNVFGIDDNDQNQDTNGYYTGNNYGGISENRDNKGSYSAIGMSSGNTGNNNKNFVAFGGAGQRLDS